MAKLHIISFGKWTNVKYITGQGNDKSVNLKVRPLYIDNRIKEFVFGAPHDVTDRLFVVRRAFRLNDALPEESNGARWEWQLGGWLLVDRVSGHVSQLLLSDFDSDNSIASWYRDYVAYCGISSDGQKLYAVVQQLGRRKPVLRKTIQERGTDNLAKSECSTTWRRQPASVTFTTDKGQNQEADHKFTFAVRGGMVDVVTRDPTNDEEEGSESE
ncbi:MAG TPA: hypothetical protein VFA74_11250 [Terriglobales bacterium]|nr:hypothetical protein [Terriglobales bacterium]